MTNTNQMQVFENAEFGQVRVIEIDGQPWFIGRDVAEILGYKNSRQALATNVDSDDKGVHSMDTLGGTQNIIVINESGLYSLILSSRLPAAKAFKHWITSDVLPTIRKHGAYITDDTLRRMREDTAFAEELLQRLADERAKNTSLLEYVDTIAPKARYYDVILQCPDAVQVSIISKDYGMTAIAFNKLLHKLGIQYKVGRTWLLYQSFSGNGYTVTKTYLVDGRISSIHTCWTQKGRFWLYELLKNHGILPEAEKLSEV